MVERSFRRDFAALEEIYGFIRDFLGGLGLGDDAAYDLDLIAEELFTNMVKYGRGGNRDIAIRLSWSPPVITIRLRDFDVEPFDITQAPPVDIKRPMMQRRAGGLGLHLVRQVADQVDYVYQDRSNIVTVTKRLGT